MEVVLKQTEGYGRTAEIELDGQPLSVVDRVSRADCQAQPGRVCDPLFDVITLEFGSWERAFQENPAREKKLQHQWGWRYLGFGEIVLVEAHAVVIDLGVLTLELRFEGADPDWVGEYLAVAVERIVLSRAGGGG